jgi:hypothetical protein
MNRLARGAPYGTNRIGDGSGLGRAIITSCFPFLDDLHLTFEARSARFDQWYVDSQAHLIYVSSCIHIVKRVEDNVKARKPLEIELLVFNVGMLGDQFDIGVELLSDVLCDNGLWLLNVFLPEEKLTIEIGEIDCIEVNDVNLTETS